MIEGLVNGDSDNRGPTVSVFQQKSFAVLYTFKYFFICKLAYMFHDCHMIYETFPPAGQSPEVFCY